MRQPGVSKAKRLRGGRRKPAGTIPEVGLGNRFAGENKAFVRTNNVPTANWIFRTFQSQRRMFSMKTLIGGAVAAVLGVIGLAVWFPAFLQLLAGSVPIVLLLGGGLALYLGFDELKDNWKKEKEEVETQQDDTDKYKQEINDLKKEIESLKKA
jgi:hypothetical protein